MSSLKEIDFFTKAISIVGILLLSTLAITLLTLTNPEIFERSEDETATWRPRSVETDLEEEEKAAMIRLGYDVITKTPELIGPLATNKRKQFAGNNLTCQSCHLEGGTKPGAGSFVGVYQRFPQFRGRENKIGTLEERIDGCMERSMNGQKMPHQSLEMQAMITYMKWLSEDVPEDQQDRYKGFAKLELPEVKADPIA